MEAVIFIGIQATGKTTFYRTRFFNTHIRLNLDMLKTRHRESIFLHACIEGKQSFVVDNTNPTLEDRTRYIVPARKAQFRIVGYYFQSRLAEALQRNAQRSPAECIPERGIQGTAGRLQLPVLGEGFDALYYVHIADDGAFTVEDWQHEL